MCSFSIDPRGSTLEKAGAGNKKLKATPTPKTKAASSKAEEIEHEDMTPRTPRGQKRRRTEQEALKKVTGVNFGGFTEAEINIIQV